MTIAIPIQLRSNWITIAWAVEGLAILWAALEIRSVRLRAHAFALFGLAFVKFLFWDTPYGYRPAFTPVFNRYFLSSLAVIGCFLGAVYLYHRAGQRKLIDGRVTKLVIGLCAARRILASDFDRDTHVLCRARPGAERLPEDAEHQRWLGQMALSVLWAAYAAALAALGFVRRIAAIRWAALALFALTVIKAMLVDIAQLQQLYRIIVFFVLGILVVAGGLGLSPGISFAGVNNMKRVGLLLFVIVATTALVYFSRRRKLLCRCGLTTSRSHRNKPRPGIYDLIVPLPVMDKARADLADLRLFDSANREIPYAHSHPSRSR